MPIIVSLTVMWCVLPYHGAEGHALTRNGATAQYYRVAAYIAIFYGSNCVNYTVGSVCS